MNHKNARQLEQQGETGIPGLAYRTYPRENIMSYTGLNSYKDHSSLTGNIISFYFSKSSGVVSHAVAAFRLSECETLFFDPNYGLYKSTSPHPICDIGNFLSNKYQDAMPKSELIISRKLLV